MRKRSKSVDPLLAGFRRAVRTIDRFTDKVNRLTRRIEAWTERQKAKRTRRGK